MARPLIHNDRRLVETDVDALRRAFKRVRDNATRTPAMRKKLLALLNDAIEIYDKELRQEAL